MNRESKPRSSTVRANSLMPWARSGPSPAQMYEGRNTPNRSSSVTSMSPELRFTLGQEGRRAFEQVVRGEDPDRGFDLRGVAGGQVAVGGLVDEALDLPNG